MEVKKTILIQCWGWRFHCLTAWVFRRETKQRISVFSLPGEKPPSCPQDPCGDPSHSLRLNFDPVTDNCDNIDNYFREPYPSLKDVPKTTKEEKTLRLVLKTSSTAVHKFLQSLPSSVTSNFHPCIRTHISLMTQQGKHSLQKIRKMSQVVWETVVTLKAAVGATEPVGFNTKLSNSSAPSKFHPPHKTRGWGFIPAPQSGKI